MNQITITIGNIAASAHWDEQDAQNAGWHAEWTRDGEYADDSAKVGTPDLEFAPDEDARVRSAIALYACELAGVTSADVETLCREAAAAGDSAQVELCEAALDDDHQDDAQIARRSQGEAMAECARAILDARAQS